MKKTVCKVVNIVHTLINSNVAISKSYMFVFVQKDNIDKVNFINQPTYVMNFFGRRISARQTNAILNFQISQLINDTIVSMKSMSEA